MSLKSMLVLFFASIVYAELPQALTSQRPRARDIGIEIGVLPPGPFNAITDVAGVRIGHQTMIDGDSIRTGVTAIIPHGDNVFQRKVLVEGSS